MKELRETRQELDTVDRELVRLFEKRMGLSRDVAEYKIAHQLPVLDAGREAIVLDSRCSMLADGRYAPQVRTLFETIMALSRQEQEKMLREAGHA